MGVVPIVVFETELVFFFSFVI